MVAANAAIPEARRPSQVSQSLCFRRLLKISIVDNRCEVCAFIPSSLSLDWLLLLWPLQWGI